MIIKTKFTTTWVILAVALILIGWDIWSAYTPIQGDTVSEILLKTALRHPILSFAFGVLMGHLFWPQQIKEDK